jgi:hypothetical protein
VIAQLFFLVVGMAKAQLAVKIVLAILAVSVLVFALSIMFELDLEINGMQMMEGFVSILDQQPRYDQISKFTEASTFDMIGCNIDEFDIIRNGTVLSDGRVDKDKNHRADKYNHRIHRQSKNYPSRPIGVLLHSHDASYYHALIEFGSRLQFTIKNCPGNQIAWIIRESRPQMKIIALLNDPPIINLTKYEPAKTYSSQTVLIPPGPYRSKDLMSLRSALLGKAKSLHITPKRTIVVTPSRAILFVQRVVTRAIINEAEVISLFLAAIPGDLTVFPERTDPPLVDAIAAFRGADIVFGGHGAGLANTLFCMAGTLVVEIRRRGTPSEFAAQLAALLGLEHRAYLDPSLPPYTDRRHYENYTVSIPAFGKFVRAAAAAAAASAPAPTPAGGAGVAPPLNQVQLGPPQVNRSRAPAATMPGTAALLNRSEPVPRVATTPAVAATGA